MDELNGINNKFQTTMDTYPGNAGQIGLMINDLNELKKISLSRQQETFNYAIDYRLLNLEAEKLYIESQSYHPGNLKKTGFGCKTRPLVIQSVQLRNESSSKAFRAVSLLREFVAKYPDEAGMANLSDKNALFLNATFYEIQRIAISDSNIINRFCPANETLELYKEEFRKKTNLSEDFISNITYDKAVILWKEIRGIS